MKLLLVTIGNRNAMIMVKKRSKEKERRNHRYDKCKWKKRQKINNEKGW